MPAEQLNSNRYGANEQERQYVKNVIETSGVEELFKLEATNLKQKIVRKFHNDTLLSFRNGELAGERGRMEWALSADGEVFEKYQKACNKLPKNPWFCEEIAALQGLAIKCVQNIKQGKESVQDKLSSWTNDPKFASRAIDGIMGPNTFYVLANIAKEQNISFNGVVSKELVDAMLKICETPVKPIIAPIDSTKIAKNPLAPLAPLAPATPTDSIINKPIVKPIIAPADSTKIAKNPLAPLAPAVSTDSIINKPAVKPVIAPADSTKIAKNPLAPLAPAVSTDSIINKPTVKPAIKPVTAPVDSIINKPTVKPAVKPVIAPADSLINKPIVKPAIKPVTAPADSIINKPAVDPLDAKKAEMEKAAEEEAKRQQEAAKTAAENIDNDPWEVEERLIAKNPDYKNDDVYIIKLMEEIYPAQLAKATTMDGPRWRMAIYEKMVNLQPKRFEGQIAKKHNIPQKDAEEIVSYAKNHYGINDILVLDAFLNKKEPADHKQEYAKLCDMEIVLTGLRNFRGKVASLKASLAAMPIPYTALPEIKNQTISLETELHTFFEAHPDSSTAVHALATAIYDVKQICQQKNEELNVSPQEAINRYTFTGLDSEVAMKTLNTFKSGNFNLTITLKNSTIISLKFDPSGKLLTKSLYLGLRKYQIQTNWSEILFKKE